MIEQYSDYPQSSFSLKLAVAVATAWSSKIITESSPLMVWNPWFRLEAPKSLQKVILCWSEILRFYFNHILPLRQWPLVKFLTCIRTFYGYTNIVFRWRIWEVLDHVDPYSIFMTWISIIDMQVLDIQHVIDDFGCKSQLTTSWRGRRSMWVNTRAAGRGCCGPYPCTNTAKRLCDRVLPE